jgi:hypothetical protein
MSFNGTWKIEIPTPIGKQDVELVIVETATELCGTATQGTETVPFIAPKGEGDHITWTQHVTKPLKLQIKFNLRRTGDLLAGTAKPGIFPPTKVTGRRIA